ncbi:MAG: phage tail sheath subtilisin-like domain-containing protein [Pirellulales bacterium]
MPSLLTYPGVYLEEIPSGVRPIVGVATSITAFLGRSLRGATNKPTRVTNFGDFERKFGGIAYDYPLSYAVRQFFLNGGTDAVIVRIANVGANGDAVKATQNVNGIPLEAAGEGDWGNRIQIRIDLNTPDSSKQFNLFVRDKETQTTEVFRNLSIAEDDAKFFRTVINDGSALIEFDSTQSLPSSMPSAHADIADPRENPWADDKAGTYYTFLQGGANGSAIDSADVIGSEAAKTGIYALEKVDLFNLLCIPPFSRKAETPAEVYTAAAKYCDKRRAMLIVDPPRDSVTVEQGEAFVANDVYKGVAAYNKNAAVFFPWLKAVDPAKENRIQEFAPCGAVAGIMARTDLTRGVWKSPAGIEAALVGVSDFTFNMTDQENGRLNILGINCLRNFRGVGNVVWGSRTLAGADILAYEWKYLAVRRFTLFLEESLYRGTQWVVFEPNDEPLWAQIRLNVGAFMQNLFRQGAFQGRSPREAYFVRCGSDTTTQNDINRGIVNVEVGFAPLKPAEFVVIKFQQMTGKIDT